MTGPQIMILWIAFSRLALASKYLFIVTSLINQYPNVFPSSISVSPVRSTHYGQIISGLGSTLDTDPNSGILTVFSLHDQFFPSSALLERRWQFKPLARNDGRLNSQGKFMQQIPRCVLCELHNQKPRYRGDSYHGHNWQRPKIELRFHHRSFWRCPYTLWP